MGFTNTEHISMFHCKHTILQGDQIEILGKTYRMWQKNFVDLIPLEIITATTMRIMIMTVRTMLLVIQSTPTQVSDGNNFNEQFVLNWFI